MKRFKSGHKKTAAVLAFLILVVWLAWALQTGRLRVWSDDMRGRAYISDIEKKYSADKYGGATPEETMQLFTKAISAGKIDEAVKYFALEKQDEGRRNLEAIFANDKFKILLSDLSESKLISKSTYDAHWLSGDAALSMQINPFSGKWKIVQF